MYLGGAYFLYKDVFDRTPCLSELQCILQSLSRVETVLVLSQINADLRLVKRERQAAAKLQQELAGAFLDDERSDDLKIVSGQSTWETVLFFTRPNY